MKNQRKYAWDKLISEFQAIEIQLEELISVEDEFAVDDGDQLAQLLGKNLIQ